MHRNTPLVPAGYGHNKMVRPETEQSFCEGLSGVDGGLQSQAGVLLENLVASEVILSLRFHHRSLTAPVASNRAVLDII